MPVQAPQWSEYLSCPVCQNEFEAQKKPPVSLACGHTACRTCLQSLQRRQCPFDQTPIGVELSCLPVNTALLQLIGAGEVPEEYRQVPSLGSQQEQEYYSSSVRCIEELALYLKPAQSSQLSRFFQYLTK
jgi:RING finger/CCCH-type zinc finger protein